MNKTDAEMYHAIARAKLGGRAGIDLSIEDYQWLTNCIRKREHTKVQRAPVQLVKKQSLRVAIWDILLPGRTLRAVYDNRRKRIVTFLTIPTLLVPVIEAEEPPREQTLHTK